MRQLASLPLMVLLLAIPLFVSADPEKAGTSSEAAWKGIKPIIKPLPAAPASAEPNLPGILTDKSPPLPPDLASAEPCNAFMRRYGATSASLGVVQDHPIEIMGCVRGYWAMASYSSFLFSVGGSRPYLMTDSPPPHYIGAPSCAAELCTDFEAESGCLFVFSDASSICEALLTSKINKVVVLVRGNSNVELGWMEPSAAWQGMPTTTYSLRPMVAVEYAIFK